MERRGDLGSLLDRHRVLVCAGAGGVGKTTVSAGLALAAAMAGKNVLCMTIDPARRLASSFGLSEFPREEMEIPSSFLDGHGISLSGRLTVMMLDPRATFDELIFRVASSRKEAERIVTRPVYAHLADNLAGTQAYMAMEKVLKVQEDERYDLIVLDTPPSARALDFFDAPKKMSDILDSPATRALITTLRGGRRFQLHLLGAGLRAALRGLQTMTGGNLLFEVAELLASMNQMLGGFEERATQVGRSLRSPSFGYVLVTTPHPRTISDAIELSRAMHQRNLTIGGVVFNRIAAPLRYDWNASDPRQGASRALLSEGMPPLLVDKLFCLAQLEQARATEQASIAEKLLARMSPSVACVSLPASGHDVYRPDRLAELARRLVPQAKTL